MTLSPSAVELQALNKFKKSLVDLVELKDYQRTDEYLLRWLRARDLNCKAALEMLQKHLVWRKENNVDEILTWQPPPKFLQDYPVDFDGLDKEGCPVITSSYGRWDIRKVGETGQTAEYLKYFTQLLEKVEARLRELNQEKPSAEKVTQMTVLCDLDGFPFRQIACKAAVEVTLKATSIMEDNYPEILKAGIMLQRPSRFSSPWSSPFSQRVLLGSDSAQWRARLLGMVPATHLIRPMGGLRVPSKEYLELIGAPMMAGSGCEDDLCQVCIKAGQNLTLDVDIERSNSTLSWRFQTDGYDIGFSVENVATGKYLISPGRVDSHKTMQSGSLEGLAAGKYLMNFNNTHAMMRSKTLRYTFSVVCGDDKQETL